MAFIYLAGPEVFLPVATEIGRRKLALCKDYRLDGLFPMDLDPPPGAAQETSTRIFSANVALMRQCDAVIANLTPFRGASADAGTVFEVGFAFALDKPVFAYTNIGALYRERVVATFGASDIWDGREFAGDGMSVENFGLCDNLMIAEAVRAQGWDVVVRDAPEDRRFTDFDGFERCLRQAAAFFACGKDAAAAA